ncbi:MAG: ABC transporter permease [Azospirillaceae bacterium]
MSRAQILRRLLLTIPTLFGVALIVFILLRVVPGDPIAMMLPPGAGEEDIARLRALYGLDRPIAEQFLVWLGAAVRGDFGTSISLRQDVLSLVFSRLPATLELAFVAIVMAILLGTAMALIGVYGARRLPEWIVDAVNGVLLAIPDFLWGLVFILAIVVLGLGLPISGRIDPRLDIDWATQFWILESILRLDFTTLGVLLRHILLPAAALALPLAAIITRVLKASLMEAMAQDYIRMARVKGLSRGRIIVGEALRNAAIPTVTLTGVQLTFLVGGTVLIERIFAYQGIGNMAIDAVINRDLPLLQGLILTFAAIFILINLAIDLTYAMLNPRLRRG